jgi:patatin-like phospholipase/acyl hydrolase
MPSVTERIKTPGRKRLLALDGGGIRGLITIEILGRIEQLLRERTGNPQLVLADFFDFIGGTSTGAIIATCLSLGFPVDRVRAFYLESGKAMFDRAEWLRRFRHKYEDERLAQKLKEVIGADTELGSQLLKTLLLVVVRNATTDSPWPLTNNPEAKYNQRSDSNLRLPLWQLVRASTAAPTFFPPEVVRVGGQDFVFVDGGMTVYSNPAFLMFLMSTLEPYRVRWPAAEDSMLLVSIGTGNTADANTNLSPDAMNLLYNASSVPSALMYSALNQQDTLCRVLGRTRYGAMLDREIGDLRQSTGPIEPRLFSYVRYDVDLSYAGLGSLGLGNIEPQNVQMLDSVEHMADLVEVGRAAAARQVEINHLADFV